MIAVDTNILVRILVDDPVQSEQVHLARQLAKKSHRMFIPQMVQVELIWVLDVAYKFTKEEIMHTLNQIHENEAFVLHREEQFASALHLFQTTNADFADCMILIQSKEAELKLATFDKKLSKLAETQLISK